MIKEGFNKDLDKLKASISSDKKWIASLQARERRSTGIKSLRVGYNKVFGYYIEVTKANLKLVPDSYERKQTLTNAERFITPELKEKAGTLDTIIAEHSAPRNPSFGRSRAEGAQSLE